MMKLAAVGVITLLVLTWAMHRSTSLASPPSRSWWRRKGHGAVAISLFLAALAFVVAGLLIDCRYLCQEWQSAGLDIIAAFAAFLMGMILAGWIDPKTMSPGDWGTLVLSLIVLLGITFILVHFFQPGPAWHKLPILALAFAFPIFGIAIKIFWPRLFCGRRDRLSSCNTPNAHRERPGASLGDQGSDHPER